MGLRNLLALCLLMGSTAVLAEWPPKQVKASKSVSNPAMVIMDRGVKLEVIPSLRVVLDDSSRSTLASASASSAIDPQHLGVVFNHSMQVRGYATGEIAFKAKDAFDPSAVASYPGLKLVVDPNIYLVVARTPQELIDLTKRLQGEANIEWVEPIVTYKAPAP